MLTDALQDISNNNIRDIDPDAFDELSYAFNFDASYNQLTNMSQVPMKYQKGIKYLNLSYNQIVEIPKNSFPKLYELNNIDFSHNNVSKIGRSVFASLFSIRHLNFSYNQLERIESSTFGKIPTLLDVDLSHNRMETIRRGAFGNLVSIRTIYLDHNQAGCKTNIDVQESLITKKLHLCALKIFSKLSVLLLIQQLTEIPRPPISLNHLHLSHNNLSR